VDAAVLGVRNLALSGEGEVATVTFRAISNGNPRVTLAKLSARDSQNHPVLFGTTGVLSGPMVTTLMPAAPNPFQNTSTLAFSLAKASLVDLAIYSVDGRKVRTLFSGVREPGAYKVEWNGTDGSGNQMRPGVYYARLVTQYGQFRKSITYLK
jgi:hypothetical protein